MQHNAHYRTLVHVGGLEPNPGNARRLPSRIHRGQNLKHLVAGWFEASRTVVDSEDVGDRRCSVIATAFLASIQRRFGPR